MTPPATSPKSSTNTEVPDESPLAPRAESRGRRLRSRRLGALFVSPYALFLLLVFAVPLGYTVWMSFHRFYFTAPGADVDAPWVGLSNYRDVFTDPVVLRSFLNIGVFLVINVPLTVVLSLVLASALNAKLPFRSFFRAAYYLPYVTASVALVAVWAYLFGTDGLVNKRWAASPPIRRGWSTRGWRCPSWRSS